MKVSEIQASDIASYLRLDDSTDTFLTPVLSAAKSYISNYTGIYDETITEEEIGAGTGELTIFRVEKYPAVKETEVVKVDGVEKTRNTDYKFDAIKGIIEFVEAPECDVIITVSYEYGLDAIEEFYIVVMILCQDMYDNRNLYTEKSNVNKVVENILGMHQRNLLPKKSSEVI